MTLDLLDLLIVSHFCFNGTVPGWLWALGVLASLAGNLRLQKTSKEDRE